MTTEAEIRARHVPCEADADGEWPHCAMHHDDIAEMQPWPCDTADALRLLDEARDERDEARGFTTDYLTLYNDTKRERDAAIARAEKAEAALAAVRTALTDEDEIAHGEARVCAYCEAEWPCRTQQGIDRLLAALAAYEGGPR
jgi:hypothetical protein